MSFSLGIGVPGVSLGVSNGPYYQPYPQYQQYQPAPVYNAPQPYYSQPAPVYYQSTPAYYGGYGYGHR